MLLEEILSRENMQKAYQQVKRNKGCAGVDNVSVEELRKKLIDEWIFIRAEILEGKYNPQPVKRIEIPKPSGGKRELGIPVVLDRMIQQAIGQKLAELYDKDFSETSYGFRAGRSCHQAVKKAQEYINQGYEHVVEVDLEKFFDAVNHEYFMHVLRERIDDKRVLRLVGRYLKAGIYTGREIKPNEEGTPQGGSMSPILSNILLDKFDKEMERREHKFVRYADDIYVFVKSKRAWERVLESIRRYLERDLKLKINQGKSEVRNPSEIKILGFGLYAKKDEGYRIRIHPKSIEKIKEVVRKENRKTKAIKLEERLRRLKEIIRGWVNYFRIADCKSHLQRLDEWLRSRIRYCIWKSWKKIKTRIKELVRLGINLSEAIRWSMTRLGGWRICHSQILCVTLTKKYLQKRGYVGFMNAYSNCGKD